VAVHFSPETIYSGDANLEAIARKTEDSRAGNIERPVIAPTRKSFLTKWQPVRGATGYRRDVSTAPPFDSYVNRYRNLDVGNATRHIVSALNRGTKYYYRVRPYSLAGMGITPRPRLRQRGTLAPGWLLFRPSTTLLAPIRDQTRSRQ